MTFLNFFICIMFVIVTATGEDEQSRWKKHSAAVNSFKCSKPQPRFIHFHELNDGDSHYRRVEPQGTVLHICRSSGCCPSKKKCLPVNQETVKLVFVPVDSKNVRKFLEIEAKNHTLCGCQNEEEQPK